jgi:hypothetical protein
MGFHRRRIAMQNRTFVVAIASIVAGTIILLSCIAATTMMWYALLESVF